MDLYAAAEARLQRFAQRLQSEARGADLVELETNRERYLELLARKLIKEAGYDFFLVAFSGGKDSLACLLLLLEMGVPRERIELWHHEIDGREGSSLMDWPCTADYCQQVAEAFGLRLLCSWRAGGFEREMQRDGTATAPVFFERPDGSIGQTGGKGPAGRRLRFPQVSADLSVRWCSGALKIDVADAALRNQARFEGARTLLLTGERAEESANRARYAPFEPHRADLRGGRKAQRHIDHWRPVLHWPEAEVWAIIERHRVNPHPAYRLGWGRVSCAACIFGSPNQWASLRAVNPGQFERIAVYERRFGVTIKHKSNVVQTADRGTPYPMEQADIAAALSAEFREPIVMPPGEWRLPRGAYGESNGPI